MDLVAPSDECPGEVPPHETGGASDHDLHGWFQTNGESNRASEGRL